MNFQGEYVYVIEESEFIKCGEKIYKVGRSAHILNRMAQYPNGSQVRMVLNVSDSVKAEQEILCQLKKYGDITHRKDIGSEYFQGNLCSIITVLSQVSNMLYEERKDTVLQDAYLEESDSDSVCDSKDTDDTSTDATEDTGDVVDTKPEGIRHCFKHAIVYGTKSNEQNMIDFVKDYIVKDETSYFTLKQAKAVFASSRYFTGEVLSLKHDLQHQLRCVCIERKRIGHFLGYFSIRNVFMGYTILTTPVQSYLMK
jgi:hypothetical protein